MSVTSTPVPTREAIAARRAEIDAILRRYHASNPRLFGSVARGEATSTSDIDILVDLDPSGGNPLLRVAGMGEELTGLLETQVDVVAPSLLRAPVSASALADAVSL